MSTDTMQPSDALERAHKEIVDRIELKLNIAKQDNPDSTIAWSKGPVQYVTDEYMFVTGINTSFYLKDAEGIKPDLIITVDTTDIAALGSSNGAADTERRVTMLVPNTSLLYYSDDDGLCQDAYMSFMKERLEQPDCYALDDFVYNRYAGLHYAHACVNNLVRQ